MLIARRQLSQVLKTKTLQFKIFSSNS